MYKRLPPWKRPLPLPDPANKETEQIIEELTARMRKEYRQAVKEVHAQMESYLSRFEAEDKAWKEAVENGEKTAAQYRDWRSTKMLTGKRWQETKMQMAQELHRRNVTARDYVTGKMPQVYAINHNYGTYEVESRGMIDTSYTLYDEDTVLRLMKNDPDILPPPGKRMKRRLKENPDLRWQFGQIQSVTIQSIIQGESIPDMARRIARTMGERNYKDCVRYARTAMTGAQNAGRYDSYRRAKKLGIDLTIEWMATLDGRTRHDHRLLDGQRREVDEPFEVEGIKIYYPGQVAGESDIPQQMIWNCRCTLVSWVKGFEADVVTESPKMGGMSYEEWKGEKQMLIDPETGEIINEQDFPAPTYAERVERARKILADAKTDQDREEAYKEAGRAIISEYDAYMDQAVLDEEERREEINKAIAAAKRDYDDLYAKMTYARLHGDQEEADRLKKEWQASITKMSQLRKDLKNIGGVDARADWLKAKLSEIRPMGADTKLIKQITRNSKSEIAQYVEKALDHYPSEWVNDFAAQGSIYLRKVGRGYWDGASVNISGYDYDSYYSTSFHELGHGFEARHKGIRQAERTFYDRRTAGQTPEWLGKLTGQKGYAKSEVAIKDDFLHPYMGKDYGGAYFELVSMGFEYAYTHPGLLEKDEDFRELIYGLLAIG